MGRRLALPFLCAAFSFICAAPAEAQQISPEQEQLSQCVTLRTTGADRIASARWIFSVMSVSPQISDMSKVAEVDRTRNDKSMAELMSRLVTKDCLAEFRAAAKIDPPSAFRVAGNTLGTIAMQELTQGAEVNAAIRKYVDYVDLKAMVEALDREESKPAGQK